MCAVFLKLVNQLLKIISGEKLLKKVSIRVCCIHLQEVLDQIIFFNADFPVCKLCVF